jgi:hypothetical protein
MEQPDNNEIERQFFQLRRNQIDHALSAFDQIRAGTIENFKDATGLDDDGGGEPVLVNVENVDDREQELRVHWSWIFPDLLPDSQINQKLI